MLLAYQVLQTIDPQIMRYDNTLATKQYDMRTGNGQMGLMFMLILHLVLFILLLRV